MNKKIHKGEKNEIEYKGGRRQARREKGGGTTSGRHTKESSKRVKDDKRKEREGQGDDKGGELWRKTLLLCGLVAWLIGSL